jgi:hypothetical protein
MESYRPSADSRKVSNVAAPVDSEAIVIVRLATPLPSPNKQLL